MQFIKADTGVKVVIGPFVDVTDGYTPETAVTLTGGGDNADEAELLKYDNATTVDISSHTWAALTGVDGYYHLTLTTSDTDTEGYLSIIVQNDSVHLPVKNDFMVVNANIYDSFFAAATSDYLDVNIVQVNGQPANVIPGTCTGSPTATTIPTGLGTAYATNDALIGRVIIFDTDTTTAAMRGQAATITDYAVSGATGTITVASGALTSAPVSGDSFQIV